MERFTDSLLSTTGSEKRLGSLIPGNIVTKNSLEDRSPFKRGNIGIVHLAGTMIFVFYIEL